MRFTFGLLTIGLATLFPSARADAADKPQLLILDLQRGPEIKEAVGRTLTDLITVEAGAEKSVTAVSGAELRSLAELEGEKALMGCDENSCLAEIAGALGARFVLSGRVSTIGSIKVMQMSVFDASTAAAVSRAAVKAEDTGGFVEKLPDAIRRLLSPIRGLLEQEAAAKIAAAEAAKKEALASAVPATTPPTIATGDSSTGDSPTGDSSTGDSPTGDSSTGDSSTTSTTAASVSGAENPYGTDSVETGNQAGDGVTEGGGVGGVFYAGIGLAGVSAIALVGGGIVGVVGLMTFSIPAPGEPVLARQVGLGAGATGAIVAVVALATSVGGVALMIGGLSE